MSEPARRDAEATIASMLTDVASDVSRLLRQEVELARTEIRTEVANATKAGRMIATGAFAMFMTAVLVSIAAMFAGAVVLAERVPQIAVYAQAIAAGGVAFLWLIIGATYLGRGRRRLRKLSLIPRRTIQTLKEDIAWLQKPTA